MAAPNAEDLVATHWPHPLYDHDHLSSAVSTARALIRYANHATLNASAETLPQANDIENVVAALYELATGLPQLTEQLAGRLNTLVANDPTLYAYAGDASTSAAAASHALTDAAAHANELAIAYDAARQQLATIGHRIPDDAED